MKISNIVLYYSVNQVLRVLDIYRCKKERILPKKMQEKVYGKFTQCLEENHLRQNSSKQTFCLKLFKKSYCTTRKCLALFWVEGSSTNYRRKCQDQVSEAASTMVRIQSIISQLNMSKSIYIGNNFSHFSYLIHLFYKKIVFNYL